MGGELLLVKEDELPEKWRVRFALDRGKASEKGDALVANFWWFGNTHYVKPGELASHSMTAKLGPNALDPSADELAALLAKRRGAIKTFLLDQSKLAGIGNAYVHDILFRAKLHPLRSIATLADAEVRGLHRAIHEELQRSIDKGGAWYEVDLHGRRGGFTADDLLVGYREGKACPTCGTTIEKIKTGSTSSFVCPSCQRLR